MAISKYQIGNWIVDPQQNIIFNDVETKNIDRKAMQVLLLLIEKRGAQVSKQEIFDRVWKDKAVTDDILSVSVSNVRKALGDNARSPTFIKTISGYGYCLIAEIKEVAEREEELEPISATEKVFNFHNRKLLALFLAIFTLVGIINWFSHINSKANVNLTNQVNQKVKSIAVMPFRNLLSGQGEDYFSEGIADIVLDRLANNSGLRVVDRFSSFAISKTANTSREIGEALGVDYIVQGSVQRNQNNIRVVVQLIDSINNNQIWSKTFDGNSNSIFEIQDNVGQAILSYLMPEQKLSPWQSRQVSAEASELYLYGNFYREQRTPESLLKAIESYSKVIELEPLFAEAYVGLSISYQLLSFYGGLDFDTMKKKAWPLLKQARELAPNFSEVHATIGALYTDEAWQANSKVEEDAFYGKAEESFIRALELSENSFLTFFWFGRMLYATDRYLEAQKYLVKAKSINPLSPALHRLEAQNLSALGKRDSAQKVYERSIDLSLNTSPALVNYPQVMRLNLEQYLNLIQWVNRQPLGALLNHPILGPSELGLIFLGVGDTDSSNFWFSHFKYEAVFPDNVLRRSIINSAISGDNTRALNELKSLGKLVPESIAIKSLIAQAKLEGGDNDGARKQLIEIYPELKSSFIPDNDNYRDFMNYALSFKTSEPKQAHRYLMVVLEFLQQDTVYVKQNAYMTMAEIYSQLGQYSKAIEHIGMAVDEGWMPDYFKEYWNIENNYHFKAIRNHDEFLKIIERFNVKLTNLKNNY